MRAAMITRYQQPLEIVNLADPKLPKDGIIMRVRATGVAGATGTHGWAIMLIRLPYRLSQAMRWPVMWSRSAQT